jgi:hypothetical protein
MAGVVIDAGVLIALYNDKAAAKTAKAVGLTVFQP